MARTDVLLRAGLTASQDVALLAEWRLYADAWLAAPLGTTDVTLSEPPIFSGPTTYNVTFAATLTSSSTVAQLVATNGLAGALTPTAIVSRQANKPIAGILTSGGSLTLNERWARAFAGTLTSAGTLARQTTKPLAGVLSSGGVLSRVASKPLTGVLTSGGVLARQTAKLTAGTLSSGAGLTLRTTKALAGTLTSSGALLLNEIWARAFAGTLTSSGNLARQTAKSLAGALTSSGAFIKGLSFARSFAGALASQGTLSRVTAKPMAGSLASSGTLGRASAKLLSGTLSSAGALRSVTAKSLAGALTGAGTLGRQTSSHFAGLLTSSSSLVTQGGTHLFQVMVSGTLMSAGAVTRQTSKAVTGTLPLAGTLARHIAKLITGALRAAGALVPGKIWAFAWGGVLAAGGSLSRTARKALSGLVQPIGAIGPRTIQLGLRGALTPNGIVAKCISHAFAGTLTAAGALGHNYLHSPRQIAASLGQLAGRWLTALLRPRWHADRARPSAAHVFTLGPLSTPWTAYATVSHWTIGRMTPMKMSLGSTEYVEVPVSFTVDGTATDPTQDTVEMAFTPDGGTPGSGDWQAASWRPWAGGPRAYARCLVGPSGGAVNPGAGRWRVWVKVVDNPETPVLNADLLSIE